jgi:hypothetical protein
MPWALTVCCHTRMRQTRSEGKINQRPHYYLKPTALDHRKEVDNMVAVPYRDFWLDTGTLRR